MLVTIAGLGATAAAQIDAGYLAAVTDLRTTRAYSAPARRNEQTLTLVPSVNGGGPGVSLVLSATFAGRQPEPDAPIAFTVRAHYALQSDDRTRAAQALVDSHRLTLDIDPGRRDGIRLAFFPASWGYGGFAPPGGEIPVAYFTLTPADVRALALAGTVTGSVLWTDFSLTVPQLDALRQFAAELLPPVERSGA